MRRCRFSKLRVSGSLKECERDMGGGGAAVGGGVAMLPLLFKAARCERTLQTTHKKKNTVQEHGSVCMQGRANRQGHSG